MLVPIIAPAAALAHRAGELGRGELRRLHRGRGEAEEAVGHARGRGPRSRRSGSARPSARRRRGLVIEDGLRADRDDLPVEAVALHVGEPPLHVPAAARELAVGHPPDRQVGVLRVGFYQRDLRLGVASLRRSIVSFSRMCAWMSKVRGRCAVKFPLPCRLVRREPITKRIGPRGSASSLRPSGYPAFRMSANRASAALVSGRFTGSFSSAEISAAV